ncbi:uncharacterized protein LOC124660482 [Lolium rigidum]|uniref:uncharacterized protein LOC124660482 n=1 Tax=Lolium rigidum TaxID=89674 RepID=UPI001F5CF216|nr:uncharacterized protein LOC124660482 [Lolium rigidum]
MGNAMPSCLVDQGTKALLPATKPNRRMYSLNLLTKALHRMKKTPCSGRAAPTSKTVIGKPPPEAEVGGAGAKSVCKASYAKASPRRAAAAARGGGHRKGVVRVKVLLSKEEAARLLSLTVGGQKNAAQIVAEIKRMEARRAAASAGWRPALASIPEESS